MKLFSALLTEELTYLVYPAVLTSVIFFPLHICLTPLRAELSLLKQHIEAQAKELDHRMHRVEELEEKERVANENVSLITFATSLI